MDAALLRGATLAKAVLNTESVFAELRALSFEERVQFWRGLISTISGAIAGTIGEGAAAQVLNEAAAVCEIAKKNPPGAPPNTTH